MNITSALNNYFRKPVLYLAAAAILGSTACAARTLEETVGATNVPALSSTPNPSSQVDYPLAEWIPADSSNYLPANRKRGDINQIVIHTTEATTLESTINWFKNPDLDKPVSAHYLIDSKGRIIQVVREKDIAWHAREYKTSSIGIEHVGKTNDPKWATEEMYQASAKLVQYLAEKYGIPADRTHIKGHDELYPKSDPGKFWSWDRYMSLVGQEATEAVVPVSESKKDKNYAKSIDDVVGAKQMAVAELPIKISEAERAALIQENRAYLPWLEEMGPWREAKVDAVGMPAVEKDLILFLAADGKIWASSSYKTPGDPGYFYGGISETPRGVAVSVSSGGVVKVVRTFPEKWSPPGPVILTSEQARTGDVRETSKTEASAIVPAVKFLVPVGQPFIVGPKIGVDERFFAVSEYIIVGPGWLAEGSEFLGATGAPH